MRQLTQDEILRFLDSGNRDQKILCLQSLLKNQAALSSREVVDLVKKLTVDVDVGITFWSKKILAKLPEPSSGNLESKTSVASPTENQPGDLSLDELFQKLTASETQADFQRALDVLRLVFNKQDPACIPALIAYLKTCRDVKQISFIVKNLGIAFPREELLPVIGTYLKHPDERTVANAIEGIEAINSPKSVVLFSQMLDHPSHRVKANATKAIAKVDPERSAEIFLKMLQMRDRPNFIIAACHAVKALKAVQFIPDLLGLLPQEVVQDDALDAILGIGGEGAWTSLETFAGSTTDEAFRQIILAAVGKARPKKAEEALFQEIEKSLDAPPRSAVSAEALQPPQGFLAGKRKLLLALGSLLLMAIGLFLSWPGQQQKFIDCLLEAGRIGHIADPKGVSQVRSLRREQIREVLGGRREFQTWTGVVEYCDADSPGACALLSVILEEPRWLASRAVLTGFSLRTWRNRFADVFDHTLIPRASPLFPTLSKLKKGDRVSISGEFVAGDDDFVCVGDVDAAKAIQTPSCIVRFTEVKKR